MRSGSKMFEKVYDISVVLGAESIDYPGDTPFSREIISTIQDGGDYDLSKLVMSAHAGTHIDTPAHFVRNGKAIDDYSVEDFLLTARVAAIKDKESIGPFELGGCDIKTGEALLFKTDNSLTGRCREGVFSEKYVHLSPEGARWCVEKKVGLVGLDYVTIDRYADQAFASHHTLLGNGIPILEGINLKEVPEGRYVLCCLPLKIRGAEASPVRAVLFR
jgi:arylformamidase